MVVNVLTMSMGTAASVKQNSLERCVNTGLMTVPPLLVKMEEPVRTWITDLNVLADQDLLVSYFIAKNCPSQKLKAHLK